jgi:shikimate 5-dehydrogenase
MLVGQAAQAIEIWWGERPALPQLMQAAEEKLGL